MALNNIRYNLIIYSKQETVEDYNRVYYYIPTKIQIKGCINKFLKKRNTNRYNGYDIYEFGYNNVESKKHKRLLQGAVVTPNIK